KSPDPEVAHRAALILKELDRRPGERALARLKAHGKNREVDQAVEILVWRPKWEDENACWQVLTALAADLIQRGGKEDGAGLIPASEKLPAGDFARYVKVMRPLFLTGTRIQPGKHPNAEPGVGLVVRGTDVVFEGARAYPGVLVAAAGSFRFPPFELENAVVFA